MNLGRWQLLEVINVDGIAGAPGVHLEPEGPWCWRGAHVEVNINSFSCSCLDLIYFMCDYEVLLICFSAGRSF